MTTLISELNLSIGGQKEASFSWPDGKGPSFDGRMLFLREDFDGLREYVERNLVPLATNKRVSDPGPR